MSTLTTTRNYADGDDLTEAELDAAFDSIETWAGGNIGTTNIATGGVDTMNIAASAVTAAKIASDAVTTAKILDGNVTGAKLATSCADASTLEVSGGSMRVKDGGITKAKLDTANYQISSSSGTFTTTSASFTDVTNLTVTITTHGRPVKLEMIPDGNSGSTATSDCSQIITSGVSSICYFKFMRDSTDISTSQLVAGNNAGCLAPLGILDVPAAGTYTYKVQAKSNGSVSFLLTRLKLCAIEL